LLFHLTGNIISNFKFLARAKVCHRVLETFYYNPDGGQQVRKPGSCKALENVIETTNEVFIFQY